MEQKHSLRSEIIVGIIGVVFIAGICIHAWKVAFSSKTEKTADQIETTVDDIWDKEAQVNADEKLILSMKEAVLGESEQQKKLQVFIQKVSDVTKITDEGGAPFKWGEKYQYIKYSGTATYTVDLSNFNEQHLSVNKEQKTLTIYVPHAVEKLDIDEDETQAGETEHVGIFSIGDLKLTEDARKEVILDVRKQMEQKLLEENAMENADRMAKMSVWEIYQPVVSKICPDYTVAVEFEKI